MAASYALFLFGAVLCAGAAAWVLRAYRRADGGVAVRAAPAFIACGFVIAVALGTYLAIGRPGLSGAPFAPRLAALKQRDPTSFTVDEALAILSQAAREDPSDPRPLFYSGQVLLDSGRAEEAARVFDAALRRDPGNVEAMLGLGRAMVRIDEGRVSPEALALFERAGAAGDDPAPFVYQAMAAMQEDRATDAQRLWGQAYARMAPDDPRRAMAQRMSTGAGE